MEFYRVLAHVFFALNVEVNTLINGLKDVHIALHTKLNVKIVIGYGYYDSSFNMCANGYLYKTLVIIYTSIF